MAGVNYHQRTELATVVAQMLDSGQKPEVVAKKVAAYLVDTHQTKDLDVILRDVLTTRAKNGVIEANVTTAFPLRSQTKAEVAKLLKQEYPRAKQLVIDETVDPEALAGVKIQTADKQLDETARGKLEDLRRMHV